MQILTYFYYEIDVRIETKIEGLTLILRIPLIFFRRPTFPYTIIEVSNQTPRKHFCSG